MDCSFRLKIIVVNSFLILALGSLWIAACSISETEKNTLWEKYGKLMVAEIPELFSMKTALRFFGRDSVFLTYHPDGTQC